MTIYEILSQWKLTVPPEWKLEVKKHGATDWTEVAHGAFVELDKGDQVRTNGGPEEVELAVRAAFVNAKNEPVYAIEMSS